MRESRINKIGRDRAIANFRDQTSKSYVRRHSHNVPMGISKLNLNCQTEIDSMAMLVAVLKQGKRSAIRSSRIATP